MFMGEGGYQEVLYEVRDNNRALSEHHTAFASRIDEGVVRDLEVRLRVSSVGARWLTLYSGLQTVRTEIKAHISAIEKEAGVLAAEVAKEVDFGCLDCSTWRY